MNRWFGRAPLGCRREVATSEYSRPPSYRSRSSSTRPSLEPGGGGGSGGLAAGLAGSLAGSLAGALAGALGAAGLHSRTASVATDHSLSDASTCPPQPVSVISVGGSGLQLDSVKCAPEQEVSTRREIGTLLCRYANLWFDFCKIIHSPKSE